MPFVLTEFNAKMQFLTSAEMPMMVYDAIKKTGHPSITAYLQDAVAEALARDLGLPLERITKNLPPRGKNPRLPDGKFTQWDNPNVE